MRRLPFALDATSGTRPMTWHLGIDLPGGWGKIPRAGRCTPESWNAAPPGARQWRMIRRVVVTTRRRGVVRVTSTSDSVLRTMTDVPYVTSTSLPDSRGPWSPRLRGRRSAETIRSRASKCGAPDNTAVVCGEPPGQQMDLDLIPEALRDDVAIIASPGYEGKLSSALHADERVESATMGTFQEGFPPDGGKSALLVITDQRVMAIQPRRKGLFGTKDPPPAVATFAPSDAGNVFKAGVYLPNERIVIVSVCGSAPPGMKGRFITWCLMTAHHDLGNFWAVTIQERVIEAGGDRRRPLGL